MTKRQEFKSRIFPGAIIGGWTFVRPTTRLEGEWLCRCACGREVKRLRRTVIAGRSRECLWCARKKPRPGNRSITVEISRRERSLLGMKIGAIFRRCYDPSNKSFVNYGARGIFVADIFHDRAEFARWIVENLPGWNDPAMTLDRINNDDGYTPGNLRMATLTQQVRNRRPRSRWGERKEGKEK